MKKVLYINAGAGSGKTYRLTHDLADLLAGTNKNGHNQGGKQIDPTEIIVTTFTVAAANEIKERARKTLLENTEKDMSAIAAKLETATIGTIHSVAQMFINKYWYAIGMVPNPDVMSDTDKKLYRNQSISQMLENGNYAAEREKIQRYYDTFRPKKQVNDIPVDYPEFWTELLDRIVSKMSYYEIDDLSNSKVDSLAEVDKVFTTNAVPNQTIYTRICKSLVDAIKDKIQAKKVAKGPKAKIVTDQKNQKKAEKLPRRVSCSSILKLHSSIKDFGVNLDNDVETLNGWLTSKYYGQIIKDCIEALFTLAEAWQKDYDIYKKKMGVIDYDDMEKGMRSLLKDEKNKAIQEEIKAQYQLIMVDEFQDCNPIQLEIFKLLSDVVADNSELPQSSVWVGDPNQAIYGFRGSNTELINEVADKFPKGADGKPEYGTPDDNGLMRDKLDTSYRSRESLVKLANKTFKPQFPQMVELKHDCKEYDEYQKAVWHWHFMDGGNTDKEYHLNLANKIKELVEDKQFYVVPKAEEGQKDEPKPRLLEYKDIAILVSRNKEAEDIAHEMKCIGVPVSVAESNIMDRIEVQLMLSLMRLAERHNDHEWASVMHLLRDIDTKEIIKNCVDDYAEIKKLAEGTDYPKWYTKEKPYAPICEALAAVKEMSFDDKLSNLILLLSVNEIVAKWGEADTRRQNLITMQSQTVAFAARCNRLGIDATVEEFVIYLNDIDIKAAKDLSSDTVKVVTYHGSKGLEWPMVILASLNETRTDDGSVMRSFCGVTEQKDKDAKYEVVVFPDFLGKSFSGAIKNAIVQLPRFSNVREAQKGDAQRLMYVGMTRAREYVVSTIKGKTDIYNYEDSKGNAKETWLSEIGIEKIDKHVWHKEDGVSIEDVPAIDTADSERHNIPLGQYEESSRKPLGGDGYVDAIVSPSKIEAEGKCDAEFTAHVIDGVHFFPKGNADHGENFAPMGTCIHNVFAAYDPTLPAEESIAMAEKVICQHGFKGCLDAERVINSITKLYDWLTENYGTGNAYHEVPFRQKRDNGTIVRGEMDLLWESTKGMVLIDFKNFVSSDVNGPLGASSKKHYFGKYLPQIEAYTEALKANGQNVIARIIYYSTLGVVVKIKKKRKNIINNMEGLTLKSIQQLADEGNAEAMARLGVEAFKGEEFEMDPDKAVEYIRKAIDKGYTDVEYFYSLLLLGKQDESSITEGLNRLEKAALRLEPDAVRYLISMWLKSKSSKKFERQAFELLDEYIENGMDDIEAGNVDKYIECLDAYGDMYAKGIGTRKNKKKAMDVYNLAAYNKSDYSTKALMEMGVCPDVIHELLDVLFELTLKDIKTLEFYIKNEPKYYFPNVRVTENADIIVSIHNNDFVLKLNDMNKAFLLLFLRHPEGVYIASMDKYVDELLSIYYCLLHADDNDKINFDDVMVQKTWNDKVISSVEKDFISEGVYDNHKIINRKDQAVKKKEEQEANLRKRILKLRKELLSNDSNTKNDYINKTNKAVLENLKDSLAKNCLNINKVVSVNPDIPNRLYAKRWITLPAGLKFCDEGVFHADFFFHRNIAESHPMDFTFDMNIYKRFANEGDHEAQYSLGHYWSVKAKKKDYAKAYRYYEMAAKQGNGMALKRMADLTIDGTGTEKNIEKALEMYEEAGKTYPEAYGELGFLLYRLIKNPAKAKEFLAVGASIGLDDYLKDYAFVCAENAKGKKETWLYKIMVLMALKGKKFAYNMLSEEVEDFDLWCDAYKMTRNMTKFQIDNAFDYAKKKYEEYGAYETETDGKDDGEHSNNDNNIDKHGINGLFFDEGKNLHLMINSNDIIINMTSRGKALYLYLLKHEKGVSRIDISESTEIQKELMLCYSYFKKKSNIYGKVDPSCAELISNLADYESKKFFQIVNEVNSKIEERIGQYDDYKNFVKNFVIVSDKGKGVYTINVDRQLVKFDGLVS